jgi:hypothetical protein
MTPPVAQVPASTWIAVALLILIMIVLAVWTIRSRGRDRRAARAAARVNATYGRPTDSRVRRT